jgi:hypothetical protein
MEVARVSPLPPGVEFVGERVQGVARQVVAQPAQQSQKFLALGKPTPGKREGGGTRSPLIKYADTTYALVCLEAWDRSRTRARNESEKKARVVVKKIMVLARVSSSEWTRARRGGMVRTGVGRARASSPPR